MKCQRRTDVSYGNPIIARVERAKADEKHLRAIRSMQPSIDSGPPKAMPHLTTFGRDYFAKKKATTEAAFADLKMIQSIAKTMTRPFELPSHRGPTSLNADWRKKELFRITMDNHKLLERLENLKPYYDTEQMERDHAEHHRHMINSSYSARKVGLYDDQIPKYRFPRPLLKPLAGSRSLGALEEQEPAPPLPSLPPLKPKKKKKQNRPTPPENQQRPMVEALEDVPAQAFLTEHPRTTPPPMPPSSIAAKVGQPLSVAAAPPAQQANLEDSSKGFSEDDFEAESPAGSEQRVEDQKMLKKKEAVPSPMRPKDEKTESDSPAASSPAAAADEVRASLRQSVNIQSGTAATPVSEAATSEGNEDRVRSSIQLGVLQGSAGGVDKLEESGYSEDFEAIQQNAGEEAVEPEPAAAPQEDAEEDAGYDETFDDPPLEEAEEEIVEG